MRIQGTKKEKGEKGRKRPKETKDHQISGQGKFYILVYHCCFASSRGIQSSSPLGQAPLFLTLSVPVFISGGEFGFFCAAVYADESKTGNSVYIIFNEKIRATH
jgi:hypothetical protein